MKLGHGLVWVTDSRPLSQRAGVERFMARSHFSITTAAIKTLKGTISGSELCITLPYHQRGGDQRGNQRG